MIQIRSVCLSAHLDTFCRRLSELGGNGLEFVYQTDDPGSMRRRVGWNAGEGYCHGVMDVESGVRAKKCDILIEMLREMELMESRARDGKKTVYVCERWLKPIPLFDFRLFDHLFLVRLPGVVRLLVPSYRRMARRFVRLMDDSNFHVCPCGVHAVRDFVRIYRILHGSWSAFFREPHVQVERKLGGAVAGFPRLHLWAYFVDCSKDPDLRAVESQDSLLRVLWVGRMLDWKRVDTLIKAFKLVAKRRAAALLLVGEGPERKWLEKVAGEEMVRNGKTEGLKWIEGRIVFHDYIKSDEVRQLMRQASVYVMPSNAEEGWGAAVSDALTERCPVISTFEAGSSATFLPKDSLYHAGSASELSERLSCFEGKMIKYNPDDWSGEMAAKRLLELVK